MKNARINHNRKASMPNAVNLIDGVQPESSQLSVVNRYNSNDFADVQQPALSQQQLKIALHEFNSQSNLL
jgi:hypothetical protein